ncbi:MAG TPA: alpha/beta family hydrolase [Thermoanaerobaculia bacterium]|nr:alpha/beta family hydrolase [Thermoanaerobaculia bacterium]
MEFLVDGPSEGVRFLFAHGAGAPMDSPFMRDVAVGLGARGVEVIRFEFPYMAARREGKRRPPDRTAILLDTWRTVVGEWRGEGRLFLGGKSMGGRMATMVADELGVDGVVCFGYPFHPAGRPQALRTGHLESIRTPTLIVQGTRDSLGNRDEVVRLPLSPALTIVWIEQGDHSLAPPVRSGRTKAEALEEAIEAASRHLR